MVKKNWIDIQIQSVFIFIEEHKLDSENIHPSSCFHTWRQNGLVKFDFDIEFQFTLVTQHSYLILALLKKHLDRGHSNILIGYHFYRMYSSKMNLNSNDENEEFYRCLYCCTGSTNCSFRLLVSCSSVVQYDTEQHKN